MHIVRPPLRILLSAASAWTALSGVAAAQSRPQVDEVDDVFQLDRAVRPQPVYLFRRQA